MGTAKARGKTAKTTQEVLYIIKSPYFLTDFIFSELKSESDVTLITHCPRKVFPLLKLWKPVEAFWLRHTRRSCFFSTDYLALLSQIKPEDSVLLFDVQNLKELLILRKFIGANKISVWLWNPLNSYRKSASSREQYARLLRKSGYEVYTFDPCDAQSCDFNEAPQVYRDVAACAEGSVAREIDLFFVGKEKGRLDLLMDIQRRLSAQGLNVCFHVVPEKHVRYTLTQKECMTREFMPYAETIDRINRSKCLLELVQESQSGVTVRSLEALFFGRKLVTNNHYIKSSDLYHPHNVFVIGSDSWDDFGDFLSQPYHTPDPAVFHNHDIRYWISRFR